MLRPFLRTLFLVSLNSALVGCGALEASPERVTLAFWEGLRDGDLESAGDHADSSSVTALEQLTAGRRFDEISTGEILLSKEHARVGTVLRTDNEEIRFDTRLAKTSEGWRVGVEETAEEVRRAEVAAAFAEVEEAILEGKRVFGAALEQGAREASEALRRAQEEIDRAMERHDQPEEQGAAP